jgi:hypothetical protein
MKKKLPVIQFVACGDLRQSANETCWPAQQTREEKLAVACPTVSACASWREHG